MAKNEQCDQDQGRGDSPRSIAALVCALVIAASAALSASPPLPVAGFWTVISVARHEIGSGETAGSRKTEAFVWLLSATSYTLTIAPASQTVTIVDAQGEDRTFTASGQPETFTFAGEPVDVVTEWSAGSLVQRFTLAGPEPVVVSRSFERAGTLLVCTLSMESDEGAGVVLQRLIYGSDAVTGAH